jgi:hypothetical protein
MSESIETLGDALPKEMARVRDDLMPQYLAIGIPGMFTLSMMRNSLDNAAKAMVSGDVVAMLRAYNDLRGYAE